MFRKMSLFVIVASFMSVNAVETPAATPETSYFRQALTSIGNAIKTIFTPSTYTDAAKNAWEGMTWENVKAAPGASFNAMYTHPYRTLAAVTILGAAVCAYINRDAIFDNDEDEDQDIKLETRNKKQTYYIGQNQQ